VLVLLYEGECVRASVVETLLQGPSTWRVRLRGHRVNGLSRYANMEQPLSFNRLLHEFLQSAGRDRAAGRGIHSRRGPISTFTHPSSTVTRIFAPC
jgi:hypothetical protein